MFAHFQYSGRSPVSIDVWKILDRAVEIVLLTYFSFLGCIPPDPGDLEIFNLSSFYFIFSLFIFIASNGRTLIFCTSGISVSGSSVNTDVKMSANSHRSHVVLDYLWLASLYKSGILLSLFWTVHISRISSGML